MAVSAARRHEALRAVPNLPDRQILLDLFERMVLLRRFESVAQIACRKGETPGFLHLYIGEEATGAGVCAHLRPTDWVTSTHRGHGHALAKGADPGRVMAELFGKVGGICGGRGGTMHLYDRSVGLFGTNGIVAAGIGHAVGIGMSARLQGRDDIGVAFFGDGAANHGAFHEALNFAAVQRAPAVFVCENNLYATATPLKSITLNPEIATKAASYGMPGVAVDGNDVFAVWLAMKEATERARSGKGPTLIEAKTYRTVGHHEGDPVIGTYRTQEELDEARNRFLKALVFARDSQSGMARIYGSSLSVGQTVEDVQKWPDLIKSVTTAQVKDAAARYLVGDQSVTSYLLPPNADPGSARGNGAAPGAGTGGAGAGGTIQ